MDNNDFDLNFFKNVTPIKVSESRQLEMHSKRWGLLSDYFLESVKVNCYQPNVIKSAATLKVSDISGQVTCVVKGSSIGLLFGLSKEEWSNVEQLCSCGQQLFYRYFKNGLSSNFRCEQKLFYNFCLSNQKDTDVLVAVFYRCPNTRNKNKDDALIEILQLTKCSNNILDLYLNHTRNAS